MVGGFKKRSNWKTELTQSVLRNFWYSIYKKELIELLFEQPYSKIEFVVNKLNVERKAASRYLRELESIGVVESEKVGRETLYINKELIEILKK